jgi:1,4-alpha-glucan branching enzyme
MTNDELERALDALVAGRHTDPHAVLGPRPVSEGLRVRVLRPEAREVEVIVDGAAPVPLRREHAGGVFSGVVPRLRHVAPYRVRARYATGAVWETRDPYAFWPTWGPLDLHLVGEGRHERLWERLGAQVTEVDGVRGVAFAVWAPTAERVSVVGDFNAWDGRTHPMRRLGSGGIWELFVPDLGPGDRYKFEVRTYAGLIVQKADPFARRTVPPPGTASIVDRSTYVWGDEAWMRARAAFDASRAPMSVYEVHLGSWRRVVEEGRRPLTYAEHARQLVPYVRDMGFTHVELLPVMEHPFGGSWGYQVTGYFAPTARWGTPDEFRGLIDAFHQAGIGVILDWVPAHFPRDAWALARFDGTALYEHLDPRQGEHPDWGTLVFNYGRNEVRNFLLASALYWLEEMHADGLRVDAVASMLYLDYSRKDTGWVPNRYGGRENLEAIALLREVNDTVRRRCPGALVIAEESTAWPGVTRPTYTGGLGFDLKWDMGWMHDTLAYFEVPPIGRKWHHDKLTFGIMYIESERFVLPLSHDEVVHLKRSLVSKMPGDAWQRHANLRALFALMWSRPGRKLLFMGGEIAQPSEWNHDGSLDWHVLADALPAGVQRLVRRLNALYREQPALHDGDGTYATFQWIDVHDAAGNVVSYRRIAPPAAGPRAGEEVICVGNLSGVARPGYRVGLPRAGTYLELLSTDAIEFGGSGLHVGAVEAEPVPWNGQPMSAELTLPALGFVWLAAPPPASGGVPVPAPG